MKQIKRFPLAMMVLGVGPKCYNGAAAHRPFRSGWQESGS